MINCFLNVPSMLLSITGNVLVLATILKTPSLRSPAVILLCSLAISDLLVGLLVQPVYIAHELKPGPVLRHGANMLFNIVCGVSLCTMTVISVDRFLALHYHMRYPNLMTEKRVLHISASIWFTVILLSCLSLWHRSHTVLAVSIIICLLVCTVSYIRIYQIVRCHQLQIQAQQQAVQSLNTEHHLDMMRSKKNALSTFIYYTCMILCYSPMFTYILIYAINPTLTSQMWTLTNTLVFMNSCINPFLYCWRVRELRTAVFKTLQNISCKQRNQRNSVR